MSEPHPLVAARAQRGWSQIQLAARLCALGARRGVNLATDRNRVWRWETGHANPDAATQALIAELFDIPSEHMLERGWPTWLAPVVAVLDGDLPWTAPGSLTALIHAVEGGPLDRRRFLALAGSTLVGLADSWANIEPGRLVAALDGRRVDDQLIGWFEGRLSELWRLDDVTGGDTVHPIAEAHLRTVVDMLRDGAYTEAQGQRLYSLAAGLCRITGWAHFDAGRHAAAQQYWHAGLRAAHTAEDHALGAYVLSNMGLQAVAAGDGNDAVSLLDTARDQVVGRASANVRAMLAGWHARAFAVVGDARRTVQTLREADDLFDGDRREDDPAWLYWLDRPSFEMGRGFLALGQPDTAAELLAAKVETLGSDFPRDRSMYLLHLAEARIAQRDVEHAAADASEGLTLAADLRSRRAMDCVAGVRDRLAEYRSVPQVADFLDHVDATAK